MDLLTRRRFLAGSVAAGMGAFLGKAPVFATHAEADKALVAITLDLEMSRNFPTWETTHWDFEKGNLNDETKKYTVEACKRVKAAGGVVHCFAVGRVFEQESVAWLKDIARDGHPIGNHTYDHVNITATKPEDIQFRFKRAPWLIEGQMPKAVIRENIILTTKALKTRIGVDPAGFRSPGGFGSGVADRPDLQQLLSDLGFTWVSCRAPPLHPMGEAGQEPTAAVYDGIVKAQAEAQPLSYPNGLLEAADEPDQRHRGLPQRAALETGLVPQGDPTWHRVGHREQSVLRLPRPSILPVRRRPRVQGHWARLRSGQKGREPRARFVDLGTIAATGQGFKVRKSR